MKATPFENYVLTLSKLKDVTANQGWLKIIIPQTFYKY